jgi:hypothetical protein
MVFWYIIEGIVLLYALSHIKLTIMVFCGILILLVIYGVLFAVIGDFMTALTKSAGWSLIAYPLVMELDYETHPHILYNLIFAPFIHQFEAGGLFYTDFWSRIFPEWMPYAGQYPNDLIAGIYCWNPPYFEFVLILTLIIYAYIKTKDYMHKPQHVRQFFGVSAPSHRTIGFGMPGQSTVKSEEEPDYIPMVVRTHNGKYKPRYPEHVKRLVSGKTKGVRFY